MKERVRGRSGGAGVGWRLGRAVAMKSIIVLRQASISSPLWAPSDRLNAASDPHHRLLGLPRRDCITKLVIFPGSSDSS